MKNINFLITILLIPFLSFNAQSDLELKGIMDLDLPTGGSTGKAVHVKAVQSISDLSIYGNCNSIDCIINKINIGF
jgi:hypothetical protein